MILVRIDRITGDVQIPGYKNWFTATSFDFGVGRKIETSEVDDQDIEIGKHETQELSIDKTTDSATVYLMQLAMKSRSESASAQPVNIDIHIVEPYSKADGSTDEAKPMRAYLKIRIENALVQSWKLNASSGDRPEESLSIWFNKAAIKYYGSKDGKTFTTYGPVGWDQYGNKDFKSDELSKADT